LLKTGDLQFETETHCYPLLCHYLNILNKHPCFLLKFTSLTTCHWFCMCKM